MTFRRVLEVNIPVFQVCRGFLNGLVSVLMLSWEIVMSVYMVFVLTK